MQKTLEEIIEMAKASRTEEGMFGIKACKETIRYIKKRSHQSFSQQLEELIILANEDMFFSELYCTMVLACWELINGIE